MFHVNLPKIHLSILTVRATALREGIFLAEWLNDSRAAEGQPTVLKAIELLRKMNVAKRKGEPGKYWETNPNQPAGQPAGQRPGDELLRILKSLQPPPTVWSIMPSGAGYYIDLGPTYTPGPLEFAFGQLSMVTMARVFDYLRQCRRAACQKWFMASRPKKEFCSPECQEEYWSEFRKTRKGRKEQARRMADSRARRKAEVLKRENVKRSTKSQRKRGK